MSSSLTVVVDYEVNCKKLPNALFVESLQQREKTHNELIAVADIHHVIVSVYSHTVMILGNMQRRQRTLIISSHGPHVQHLVLLVSRINVGITVLHNFIGIPKVKRVWADDVTPAWSYIQRRVHRINAYLTILIAVDYYPQVVGVGVVSWHFDSLRRKWCF